MFKFEAWIARNSWAITKIHNEVPQGHVKVEYFGLKIFVHDLIRGSLTVSATNAATTRSMPALRDPLTKIVLA